ncbi:MAG: PaaI family thioesterase [Fusobacteriaceae bacterium]|jgi:acyl-CoA thioesterase|nr:PaaI family thioesterase [Fusobacteriaceae bacterium]
MDFEKIKYSANEGNPVSRLLGMRIVELDEEHSLGVLTATEKLLNPYGCLHGGALYTLADTTAGVLSRASGRKNVTLEGQLNFVKAVPGGTKIKALAKKIHKGNKTSVYTVRISNENDEIVAAGIYTMFYVE